MISNGKREKPHPWADTTAAKIGTYLGVLLLIGCHPNAGKIDEFWDCRSEHIFYPWTQYIPHARFDQLSRFLKLNDPEEQLDDDHWFGKFEPLASHWRSVSRRTLQPGSRVTVDEQLIEFTGRSKHILRINSKAAGQGYKIYTLCTPDGYVWDFLFSSKIVGRESSIFEPTSSTYAETRPKKAFSSADYTVLTLVDSLRKQWPGDSRYAFALDNFFTNHLLLSELKEWKIGAFGTCRAGAKYPEQFILLRDVTTKEKDYGLERNALTEGINCHLFVDQKAVWMMTNMHDTACEHPLWRDLKTRPNASIQRARTYTNEDEEEAITELPIPQIMDGYNQSMGGSDQAQKIWLYYTVSRHKHFRNWWPLLHMILDATISNILAIFRNQGKRHQDITHKDLQERIGWHLLQNPAAILRRREMPVKIRGQQPSKIRPRLVPGEHHWRDVHVRVWCEVCRPTPKKRGCPPLSDITNTTGPTNQGH